MGDIMKNKKNIILTNIVTSLRVLGIFFLIPIYLTFGGLGLGIANIICFLTDFVDGKMARSLDASTFFGSLYDGFSDKVFVIMNFLILASITPWALVPLAFELGIAGSQYLKFKNNLNVKSNMIGKIKMWVIGLFVIIANLLLSKEQLTFLGNSLLSKIASLNNQDIVNICLGPLIFSEVLTLTSYILEFVKGEKNEKENKEVVEEKKEKEEIEEDYTLKEMLFDHDFYVRHQDESALKLLRKRKR